MNRSVNIEVKDIRDALMSLLAGGLIAIGSMAVVLNENKYIGAMLFSFALLSIIKLQLPLYTGRVGFVLEKCNVWDCVTYLCMNCIGACLFKYLFIATQPEETFQRLRYLTGVKFDHTLGYLFFSGFLCNVLVHVAVSAKNEFITVLCVMCFVICGFEHSIADVMFVSWKFAPQWGMILLGNTVGAILTNTLMCNWLPDNSNT